MYIIFLLYSIDFKIKYVLFFLVIIFFFCSLYLLKYISISKQQINIAILLKIRKANDERLIDKRNPCRRRAHAEYAGVASRGAAGHSAPCHRLTVSLGRTHTRSDQSPTRITNTRAQTPTPLTRGDPIILITRPTDPSVVTRPGAV